MEDLQRIGEMKDRPTLDNVAKWEAVWDRVRASGPVAPSSVAIRFQKLHAYVSFSPEDIQQIAEYAEHHHLGVLDNVVAWTRAWHEWRTEVGRRYDFTPVGGRNELAGGAL
jgi:hypothetical protein